MKKYDLVELKNNESGIVISIEKGNVEVMLLNKKNYGDYAFVTVKEKDLKYFGHLQENLISELEEFLGTINIGEHSAYKEIKVKEYDKVKLLVEDIKYSQYGVHKGAVGCVIQDYLIKNEVMVDFSSVNNDGHLIGDTIVVSVEDLEVI